MERAETIKVLHNDDCSKSRAILEYLDEHNIKFEIINLLQEPLTEAEMDTLLKKLSLKPSQLVRRKDKEFVAKFGAENLSEDQYKKIMLENPQFIQRPVLVKGSVAMIGRPFENVKLFVGH